MINQAPIGGYKSSVCEIFFSDFRKKTFSAESIVMSDPSDATDAHYVDVPRGVTVYNRECNCPQRTCIVEAVTSYLNVLKSNDSPLAENRCHL